MGDVSWYHLKYTKRWFLVLALVLVLVTPDGHCGGIQNLLILKI